MTCPECGGPGPFETIFDQDGEPTKVVACHECGETFEPKEGTQ